MSRESHSTVKLYAGGSAAASYVVAASTSSDVMRYWPYQQYLSSSIYCLHLNSGLAQAVQTDGCCQLCRQGH